MDQQLRSSKKATADAWMHSVAARRALDDGDLVQAEYELAAGEALLSDCSEEMETELSLTLQLLGSTVELYRGEQAVARVSAEEALRFAGARFNPHGIEVARARLQHNFTLEANHQFSAALKANLDLQQELVSVPSALTLRLNCLTRAIACAVKNADRLYLSGIGIAAEEIFESLSGAEHHRQLSWYYFWAAVASLRQGNLIDVKRLLDHAEMDLGAQSWRWCNAASFVEGHLGLMSRRTRAQGIEILTTARRDAEEREFFGHVRSIVAGVSGPEV
jgi:hypothetical protein